MMRHIRALRCEQIPADECHLVHNSTSRRFSSPSMTSKAISSGNTASVVQPMIAARVRIRKGVICTLQQLRPLSAHENEMELTKGRRGQASVTSLLRSLTLK